MGCRRAVRLRTSERLSPRRETPSLPSNRALGARPWRAWRNRKRHPSTATPSRRCLPRTPGHHGEAVSPCPVRTDEATIRSCRTVKVLVATSLVSAADRGVRTGPDRGTAAREAAAAPRVVRRDAPRGGPWTHSRARVAGRTGPALASVTRPRHGQSEATLAGRGSSARCARRTCSKYGTITSNACSHSRVSWSSTPSRYLTASGPCPDWP